MVIRVGLSEASASLRSLISFPKSFVTLWKLSAKRLGGDAEEGVGAAEPEADEEEVLSAV